MNDLNTETLMKKAIGNVTRERYHQNEKHPNSADLSPEKWLAVLAEEIGEASEHINDGTTMTDFDNYFNEVVQVAAVALRWVENEIWRLQQYHDAEAKKQYPFEYEIEVTSTDAFYKLTKWLVAQPGYVNNMYYFTETDKFIWNLSGEKSYVLTAGNQDWSYDITLNSSMKLSDEFLNNIFEAGSHCIVTWIVE